MSPHRCSECGRWECLVHAGRWRVWIERLLIGWAVVIGLAFVVALVGGLLGYWEFSSDALTP